MGGLIPLRDASRRPARIPVVTIFIILVNAFVFVLELMNGERFVTQWSAIPAQIVSGHHWITILTAMFMHGSWLHIIGNMIFLWAFAPEIEDAMGRGRYLFFYLLGGLVAMLAQVAVDPHSTVPNLGASGAIAAVMGAFIVTYPRDRIKSVLFIFVFARITFIPAALLIGFWFLTQLFRPGRWRTCRPVGWRIWPTLEALSSEPPPRVCSKTRVESLCNGVPIEIPGQVDLVQDKLAAKTSLPLFGEQSITSCKPTSRH
jgi:membrane associated rhomboid family serine protease